MTQTIQKEPTIRDVMNAVVNLQTQLTVFATDTMDFFVSMKKDFDRLEEKVDGMGVRLSDVEVACTQNTRAIRDLDDKFTVRFDRLESMTIADTNALGRDFGKHSTVLKDHGRRIRQLELTR